MTETKFTPGPWKATEAPGKEWARAVIAPEAGNEPMNTVATIFGWTTPPTYAEANANLIAAAPEMYEACEEGARFMENNTQAIGPLIKIKQALAKARGES